MIKYIVLAVVLIGLIAYEAWNQRKIRDAEWYERDFRSKVFAFMKEFSGDPKGVRSQFTLKILEDISKSLREEKEKAESEHKKAGQEQAFDKSIKLTGKIDAYDKALYIVWQHQSPLLRGKAESIRLNAGHNSKSTESYDGALKRIQKQEYDLMKELYMDNIFDEVRTREVNSRHGRS